MGRVRKTKTLTCKNCGREFRVKKNNNNKKFCSKRCRESYNKYVYRWNNNPYIKKLKDKINYDPSKEYMKWQDDRYNENIGTKQVQRMYNSTDVDKYKDESKCDKKDKDCINCEDKICYDMTKYLNDYKKRRNSII